MPYIPTMPKNRIFPVIGVATLIPLAAWAQAPAPKGSVQAATAAAEVPTDAEKQLDEAAKQVAALKSVEADIHQSVDMLDQAFTVSGRFLMGPDRRFSLRLEVSGLPDAKGTMSQVCDGTVLWDYQHVLESESYRRLEIAQVLERLKSPEIDEPLREGVMAQFGFGGPEALLKGLRRAVKFDQKEAGTLDGKEVWVLRGEWKDRSGLAPNSQPLPPTVALPPYVPSLVVLWVGKDNGWPYKLKLVGRVPAMVMETRKKGQDGQYIGSKSSIQQVKKTDITLEYRNVKLNPSLSTDEFVFQPPPSAKVEDQTQSLVAALDNYIATRARQKKDEAAKSEDPLLKESIQVPRPGDATPTLPGLPGGPGASPNP